MLQPNYFMAKIDLWHAYRSVPIHKSNYVATGVQWHFAGHNHPTYFFDTWVPFGAKSSPEIFHRLTQSVCHMMERCCFKTMHHCVPRRLPNHWRNQRRMSASLFNPTAVTHRFGVSNQLA